ncbi:MAG TPA: TauD/TfdA family dioxygenase [Vicinamibacterales bacterium]|nr:TauD/TfdA family dioxygenase [Vicinamibacterales bacterium]
MWHRRLSLPVQADLARRFAGCGPLTDDPEPFLARVYAGVGALPPDLVGTVLRFRADPSASGVLLIHGMPVDEPMPPTPTAAGRVTAKSTFVSEASVLLIALLLGDPVAYADEKDGVLVQNVYPIDAEARAPSNESSDTDLGFHTELSFSRRVPDRPLHAASPDFLLLLGLRGAPDADAVTTFVEAGDICGRLSARVQARLRQPLYELRAPYSFTRAADADRPWSRPVPLLHGDGAATWLAFDLACGVRATEPAATEALDELRQVVASPDLHRRARLEAGDLLVVDNRRCAHARSRFQARFDGADRWLQRVYVRRSLAGLERAAQASFRVL